MSLFRCELGVAMKKNSCQKMIKLLLSTAGKTVARKILLVSFQGDVAHALHRIRSATSSKPDRLVDDNAVNGNRWREFVNR